MKMRRLLSLALALVMVIGMTGCGDTGSGEGTDGSVEQTGMSKWLDEDGKVHVYASVTQTLTSLDWMDCNNGNAFNCVFFMIATPLIGSDHNGNYDENAENYSPGVAERYEYTEDGKEWTFYLRKGITFNNGEVCNADDVVATLERVIKYKGQKQNLGGLWTYLDRVEKIDDYTVKAYFTETYGTPHKSMCEMFILSDTDYAELGEDYFYEGYLYGTGAWQFEDYMDGQYVTLSRRDDYWGENDSNVDRFTLYFVTEENAVVNGLTSGTIDFTPRLSSDLLDLVHADGDLEEASAETYGSYAMIGLQCGDYSPFHDINLRKAFSYCIDRQMIADTIMGGGVALQQWIPQGSLGYDETLVPIYDVELAKEYMAKSDYSGEEIVLYANSPVNNAENIATAICDYARAVGINMSLQITEQAYTTEVRNTGEYDAYLVTNSSTGDVGPYTITRLSHPGANHNFYNDRLDELLEELELTIDLDKRDEIEREINQIIYDNCVLVSLFTMDYHYVARKGLSGWYIPYSGYFYCENIRVDEV